MGCGSTDRNQWPDLSLPGLGRIGTSMHCVAAFYRFAPVADPLAQRDGLQHRLQALGLKGSVILAFEGVNGTLAGEQEAVTQGIEVLSAIVGPVRVNRSLAAEAPFKRLRVKVKREIVTMGVPATDPGRIVGTYVAPADWNALITADDVVVIDTRNDYEVALGSFARAVDPGIGEFRAFPGWWRDNVQAFAGKRVAMFCTGGIRCEKATSFALTEGATEVFHLDGGILRYLLEVEPEQSLWRGECFVFDERTAVGPGCRPGVSRMCQACGRPLPLQYADDPLQQARVAARVLDGQNRLREDAGSGDPGGGHGPHGGRDGSATDRPVSRSGPGAGERRERPGWDDGAMPSSAAESGPGTGAARRPAGTCTCGGAA